MYNRVEFYGEHIGDMKSRHSSPDFGGDNVIDSTFRRLKWVGFVVPLAFLFVFLYLVEGPVHDLLHSAWGFLTLWVVLTFAVIFFALAIICGFIVGSTWEKMRSK